MPTRAQAKGLIIIRIIADFHPPLPERLDRAAGSRIGLVQEVENPSADVGAATADCLLSR